MFRRCRFAVPLGAIALAAALPAAGQVVSTGDAYPDKYPPVLPARKGPGPPQIVIEPAGDVALSGPLASRPLRLVDGRIVVALEDGAVAIATDPGVSPAPEAAIVDEVAAVDPWVEAPDGRLRFRTELEGRVLAEKRRRPGRPWRKAWSLRVAGGTPSPPLIVGPRLVFAALDDVVYCVRADNGHRVWARDVGGRVSRTPMLWRAVPLPPEGEAEGPTETIDLLFVVPDGGDRLVAIDAYNGRVAASASIASSDGWLTSAPVALGDGRVAAARQGYRPEEAALAFYRVRAVAPAPGAGPERGYNADPSAPSTSPGR